MLIDFNRRQWELIYASLVYNLDLGDMTEVDNNELMQMMSLIESRVING